MPHSKPALGSSPCCSNAFGIHGYLCAGYLRGSTATIGKRISFTRTSSACRSFCNFTPLLHSQFLRLSASHPFSVPPAVATAFPSTVSNALASTSEAVVYLTANASRSYCVFTGVNMLSANTSAVTVTIVLNIRKLVSS